MEGLKKSPEKPGDWDLKPGDFQNMRQIKKNQQIIWLSGFFFYLFSALAEVPKTYQSHFVIFFRSRVLDNE